MSESDDEDYSIGVDPSTGIPPQLVAALRAELTGIPTFLVSNSRQQAQFRANQSRRRAERASIYRPALRASLTSALTAGAAGGSQVTPAGNRLAPPSAGSLLGTACSRRVAAGDARTAPVADSTDSTNATVPDAPPVQSGQRQHPTETHEKRRSDGLHGVDTGEATAAAAKSSPPRTLYAGSSSNKADAEPVPSGNTVTPPAEDAGPDITRPGAAWAELSEATAVAFATAQTATQRMDDRRQDGRADGLRVKLDKGDALHSWQRLSTLLGTLPAHRFAAQLLNASWGAAKAKQSSDGLGPAAQPFAGPASELTESSLIHPVQGDGEAGLIARAVALLTSNGVLATPNEVASPSTKPHAQGCSSIDADRDQSACHSANAHLMAEALLTYFGLPSMPYPELIAVARGMQVLRCSLPSGSAPNLAVGLTAAPDCVTSIGLVTRLARQCIAGYLSSLEVPPPVRGDSNNGDASQASQGERATRLGQPGSSGAPEQEVKQRSWRDGKRLRQKSLFDWMDPVFELHALAVDHARVSSGEQGGGKKAVARFQKAYRDELRQPGQGHSEALGAAHTAGASAGQLGSYSKQIEDKVQKHPRIEPFLDQLPRLIAWDKAARAELAGGAAQPAPPVFGTLGIAAAVCGSAAGGKGAGGASRGAKAAGAKAATGGSGSSRFDRPEQRLQLARVVLGAAIEGRRKELVAIGPAALQQAVAYVANVGMLRQTPLPHCAGGHDASRAPYGPIMLRLDLLTPGQLTAASDGMSSRPAAATGPAAGDSSKPATLGAGGRECQDGSVVGLEDCLREAAVSVMLLPCGAEEERRVRDRRRYALEARRRLQGGKSGPRDFVIELPERRHREPQGAPGNRSGGPKCPDEALCANVGLLHECLRVYGCAELSCWGCYALQDAAQLIAQANRDLQVHAAGSDSHSGDAGTAVRAAGEARSPGLEVVPYVHDANRDVRIGEARDRILAALPLRRLPDQGQRPGRSAAQPRGGKQGQASARRDRSKGVYVVDDGWEVARRVALNREMCGMLGLADPVSVAQAKSELEFDPTTRITLFVLRQRSADSA